MTGFAHPGQAATSELITDACNAKKAEFAFCTGTKCERGKTRLDQLRDHLSKQINEAVTGLHELYRTIPLIQKTRLVFQSRMFQ